MSNSHPSSIEQFGEPELFANKPVRPDSRAELARYVGMESGIMPWEHPVAGTIAPYAVPNEEYIDRTFWLGAPIRGEEGIVHPGKGHGCTVSLFNNGDAYVATPVTKHWRIKLLSRELMGGLTREELGIEDGNINFFKTRRIMIASVLFALINPSVSPSVHSWSEMLGRSQPKRAPRKR